MLPIVEAMQLLAAADYQPLGPLVDQREFPLLVKKERVVYVAKLAQLTELPVLEKLLVNPVVRMPRLRAILPGQVCAVSVETLINGQTLAAYLHANGPLPARQVTQLATELLATLQALAQLGIVHRDVKLSNIMLSGGHAYLIDVNAARFYQKQANTDTRLLGTSGFAAPENYGFAQTDQRSDLYALGIVLNCLLTGATPGPGPTRVTALRPWNAILKKATALDPAHRYQTATEMLASLPVNRPQRLRLFTAQRYWPSWLQVRRGLGRTYGLFWLLIILVGFEQRGLARQLDFYWGSFVLIGLPVVATSCNRLLRRRWSLQQWQRRRGWLRALETLVILFLLARI